MSDENRRSADPVIDLTREADFRLGDLRVRPSTREVERGGEREALEPRVMQVLVALYRAQGEVVSRDALIARCWSGRIVGEDAISRAIWRLRKLAEADDKVSFSIETIPRVGYRLVVAPPAEAGKATAAPANGGAARGQRHRRLGLLAALALVAIGAAAIAYGPIWRTPQWTVESSRSFISTLALEGEPAISSNGAMLAYTSGPEGGRRQIYVHNIAGGDAIRVTNDAYDDASPSWSPDGAHLAYVAVMRGEPCRIMVAAIPAGEAREVGRCARAETTSVSWQPGTSFLYYFEQSGPPAGSAGKVRLQTDTIVRLDADSGRQQVLPKKPLNPILAMRHLQSSPDGKSLLLVGRETALTDAVVIHDLASQEQRVLAKIVISGSAAWSEDSRTVLTTTASGIGSEIRAYPLDGGAPYHVYAATINVSHLATGAGGLLALETDPGRQNLARAGAQAAQPDIIDPANGRSWAPTFAPDGTLAFLSNRSGTNAVWIMRPGAPPALLYNAGLSPVFRLEFSPDGKLLAMPVAGEHGVTVAILTSAGANVVSFHSPTLGGGAPTWTPDSKAVVLFDKDVPAYVRVDIADPARRSPVVPAPWGVVIFHQGAMFAARFDQPGYWQYGKGPRLVTAKYPMRWDETPALMGDDLLVPDFKAAGGPRILAQPLAGGPDRVAAYAPGAQAQEGILESKIAVNPKSGEIIYVAAVQSDTNIDLLSMSRR